jgi:hypothetical protein
LAHLEVDQGGVDGHQDGAMFVGKGPQAQVLGLTISGYAEQKKRKNQLQDFHSDLLWLYRIRFQTAEAVTGVKSLPQALFITWVENPSAAIDQKKADAIGTAKIWNIVWLINVLAVGIYTIRKKRKAERNPQGVVPPAVS